MDVSEDAGELRESVVSNHATPINHSKLLTAELTNYFHTKYACWDGRMDAWIASVQSVGCSFKEDLNALRIRRCVECCECHVKDGNCRQFVCMLWDLIFCY